VIKLLLDEHISPAVAAGVRRHLHGVPIYPLVEWESGGFLGQGDDACLMEAARQGLTMVTYDRRTIPPLLKMWAEQGISHGGVIFVDEKTISPADIGGLVRALVELARKGRKWEWRDRICFLR
jgi:hypothetical protein